MELNMHLFVKQSELNFMAVLTVELCAYNHHALCLLWNSAHTITMHSAYCGTLRIQSPCTLLTCANK